MTLKEQRVVEIMEKKLKIFNEDEKLRDMYYKRDLNRMDIEADKQDARVEGKLEDKADFIQARYGKVDKGWLKSLNEKQIESIYSIIFKEADYEKFKLEVEKYK